ncbi:MAG: bifunctional nicotinamidase/pyrazinamidase [Moraxella sp.]|nr:bifunctional nicotinamidase/pyrazinamidase [Moraxella sp.]
MSAQYNTYTITHTDALLVVDVQNDFCPTGSLPVPKGDEVVPIINDLIPKFTHIVLTQDWHPNDHISFAANHADKAPFETIELPYGEQVLWAVHCVQDSDGAEFHKDLRTHHAQLIIRKGHHRDIDSYSAFLEADRITLTGLSGYLQAHGIQRVFVAGLATDFCVAWTAVDAVHFGFETFVIDDACRAIDTQGSLNKAWADMEKWGVKKVGSSDIL